MKVFVKKTQRILDGFFKVDRAVIQHEKFNGEISEELERLNLDRGDAVAALLINRVKQTLILIKQFRYPVYTKEKNNAWVLEIVAGMVEKGLTAEKTIIHEIAEETGYQVSKVNQLFYFYPTPGGSNEKVYLYFAEIDQKDLKSSGGGVISEGEDILVQEISFDEAFKMLDSGEIVDAKTIIALQWLKAHLKD